MNLYKIETDISGYDTYDSAVYAAESEQDAIDCSESRMGYEYQSNTAEFIGIAKEGTEEGEICSSFNAG